MKLFCVSDLHSFFTPFKKALDEKGFEPNNPDHLLVVCGDIFDRGRESVEMLKYLDSLTNVVLVRGNHEDLLEEVWRRGYCLSHDHSNGTMRTVHDIFFKNSNIEPYEPVRVSEKVLRPFLDKMVNYFETKNYIFVHGWIPCEKWEGPAEPWYEQNRKIEYNPDWRTCNDVEWESARWLNGIDMFLKKVTEPGKTIVCGHWHCSYGHYLKAHLKALVDNLRYSVDEVPVTEFGDTAIWEPFTDNGILAIDRCTARTGEVNVVVLEDELLEEV